jgi:hypothetical protein
LTEPLERLAHYQALVREVNERIRDVADLDVGIFICECGSRDCLCTITLSLDQYGRIRSNPTWFVLKPGHAVREIARVVSEDADFMVVERLAVFDQEQETDPQSFAEPDVKPQDAALGASPPSCSSTTV